MHMLLFFRLFYEKLTTLSITNKTVMRRVTFLGIFIRLLDVWLKTDSQGLLPVQLSHITMEPLENPTLQWSVCEHECGKDK